MKKRMWGSLLAAAFTSILVTAPTASAAPDPEGCAKGNFCVHSNANFTGLVLRSGGNWSGSVPFRSISNNGVPYPGLDHIEVHWHWAGDTTRVQCLHYNPDPNGHSMVADYPGAQAYVTKVRWRGEC
ncbi:peptidase inhibitor family I36 protein [Streptomyces sp. NPDC126510]|uniref:peptidase inhibitor family I36 protein n=1 Tax=Streptomyces sp. NPDC126510 TaxID=3155317 RepID=UPI003331476B